MALDIRQLRTLIAVAEYRTFASAGDAIGLTQSSVSLHIKALEDDLHTELFDRSRRPPVLNSQGRALVERAREVIKLCDDISRSISNDELAGSLNLGAVPTCLAGVLPSALASLRAEHPNLQIRVTSGLSIDLVTRLTGGELDVVAVTEPSHIPGGTEWQPFVKEPLVVIAPPGSEGETDQEILESQPYIRFSRKAWAGQLIEAHLIERNIRIKSEIEIDSLEAISLMVANGLGASVVPSRCHEQKIDKEIKVLPFGNPQKYRIMGLLWRETALKSHLIDALHNALYLNCQKAMTKIVS